MRVGHCRSWKGVRALRQAYAELIFNIVSGTSIHDKARVYSLPSHACRSYTAVRDQQIDCPSEGIVN